MLQTFHKLFFWELNMKIVCLCFEILFPPHKRGSLW